MRFQFDDNTSSAQPSGPRRIDQSLTEEEMKLRLSIICGSRFKEMPPGAVAPERREPKE